MLSSSCKFCDKIRNETKAECAFRDCTGLTSVKIPDSVTSVCHGAFHYSYGVIEVDDGVSYVDGWAIDCDKNATCVQLRPGTRGIADFAFSHCEELTSVTIPYSVTSVGYGAFWDCGKLSTIDYQGTTAQWQAINEEIDDEEIASQMPHYTVYCTDGKIDKYDD